MRQRNYVKAMACACNTEFSANYFLQFFTVDELLDSQPSHGNDETRLQNPNLIVHPRRAVADLVRRRHAISAAGIFSRKTPTNGREINSRPNGSFIHSAKLFEPSKKRFASGMREGSLQNRLPRAGRLANDHDVAHDCAA